MQCRQQHFLVDESSQSYLSDVLSISIPLIQIFGKKIPRFNFLLTFPPIKHRSNQEVGTALYLFFFNFKWLMFNFKMFFILKCMPYFDIKRFDKSSFFFFNLVINVIASSWNVNSFFTNVSKGMFTKYWILLKPVLWGRGL
jgi:hypothetical protein